MLFLTISFGVLAIVHAQDEGDAISSRILYGKRAHIKDYPFFAALTYNGTFDCGAVILSDRWLATASHCYDRSFLNQNAAVVVGTEDIRGGQHYKVDQEIQHKNLRYIGIRNYLIGLNDIALLRLNRPLTFSDKVKPIQLPQHDYEVNVLHSVAGMGIDETDTPSKYLMEATTRTYNITEYSKVFTETELRPYKELMSKILICTKRDGDMPSFCSGDSGSPLVHDNTLVGLVIYGDNRDCKKARRVMFTNVFPYLDWIKSITGIH